MAVLKIIYEPNPHLHLKAEEVSESDPSVKTILNDMVDTLGTLNGIGLAATQVDIMKRLIIIDLRGMDDYDENHKLYEEDKKLFKIVNPKITGMSDTKISMNEGCLSLPSIRTNIVRPAEIDFEYYDENFKLHKIHARGLFAKCIQHEMDHLNGITMFNYMSKLKQDVSLKKIKKIVKILEEDEDGYQ